MSKAKSLKFNPDPFFIIREKLPKLKKTIKDISKEED